MRWFHHNPRLFSRWTPPTPEQVQLHGDMMRTRGNAAQNMMNYRTQFQSIRDNRGRPGWDKVEDRFNQRFNNNTEGGDTEASTRSQGSQGRYGQTSPPRNFPGLNNFGKGGRGTNERNQRIRDLMNRRASMRWGNPQRTNNTSPSWGY